MSSSSPSRPLWRLYLGILLPMMLTNVLQAASGTLDGIWIGQLLGLQAIAAVSAFFPILFLALSLVIGLSSGAAVLIGQAWGAGDRPRVRRIAATAIVMVLALSLPIALFGHFAIPGLLQALGTPAAVLPAAVDYARLMTAGCPVIFLLWLVTSMSRGVGDAVSPLFVLVIATALSLAATPALIEGWAGLPRLGVTSAAFSTIGAYALSLLWLAWHWRRRRHPLAPTTPRAPTFDVLLASAILRIGLPTACQMMSMAVAELVLLGLVNRHGVGATACYGAINQIMSWVQFPVMSLGITATVLASHSIGAGRLGVVGPILVTGLRLNLVTTGAFVVAAYMLAPVAIGLFITEAATALVAVDLLHIVLWSVVLAGWSAVLSGVMRADGTVLVPTGLFMAAIVLVEVPLACLLDAKIGLSGIWIGYAAGFAANLLLQAGFYGLVWSKRPARRLT
jgi:putative MATE family efflux protein